MNLMYVSKEIREKFYKYLDKKDIEERFKDPDLKKESDECFEKRLYKITIEEWIEHIEKCIHEDEINPIYEALILCIEEKIGQNFPKFEEFNTFLKEKYFISLKDEDWDVLNTFKDEFSRDLHFLDFVELVQLYCSVDKEALLPDISGSRVEDLEKRIEELSEQMDEEKSALEKCQKTLEEKNKTIERLQKELDNAKNIKKENNKLNKELDKLKQKWDSKQKKENKLEVYSGKLSDLLEVSTEGMSAQEIYLLLNDMERTAYQNEDLERLKEIASAKFFLYKVLKGE
ncbi:MAG: hypothetical protein Q4C49_05340 [Bacillota bacterium]|nr:hypothetical protein [Bacillota bacterium]